MGSYSDRILNCVLCGLRGKCVPDEFLNGAEPLTDCDFAGGPLCAACLKAGVLDSEDEDPSATPLSASQPVPEVRCGRPDGNTRTCRRPGAQYDHDDKTKADVDNQKKAAAVNEKKAEAYIQQTAEADTQKTASDADIHQKTDADSPMTEACEKRKVVLPAAQEKPGNEKRRRVQESDCIT